MNTRRWFLTLAAAALFVGGYHSAAQAAERRAAKELVTFGTLKAVSPEEARAQALDWLKGAGKTDAASLRRFEAIWNEADRPVLDRVADTLTLGDAEAAKLLAEARDEAAPAPLAVPQQIKDAKRPAFYRANLALAYAKALSQRRVYEETLDVLRSVKVEQVVDPAAYLFHKAVAEHALLLKDDASRSIARLLDDVADAPERYKHLTYLMHFDMLAWREKDLGWIARKMDNIERRLDLARGGPQTQKIQKEVVNRLDELIKEKENQCKGSCASNGGACPNGGNAGGGQSGSPMQDSRIATNSGPGNVDQKRLEGLAKAWGKLPEKERAAAMESLKRDLPPRYREAIESYFKKMAQGPSGK